MNNKYLASVLAALCLTPVPTLAVPVVTSLGAPLTLNSSNLVTAGTSADPWLLDETFAAVAGGTLQFTDTDGDPLAGAAELDSVGSWFTKTVLNNSGTTWTSFEMELQEILGTASGEGDGLSFAQALNLVFFSSEFSTITRIDTTRDYLNFSGGEVLDGESVTFGFAVTDYSPQSPFYLLQTPNLVDRPLPEPGSIALLGIGLAGLAFRRRKRV